MRAFNKIIYHVFPKKNYLESIQINSNILKTGTSKAEKHYFCQIKLVLII